MNRVDQDDTNLKADDDDGGVISCEK